MKSEKSPYVLRVGESQFVPIEKEPAKTICAACLGEVRLAKTGPSSIVVETVAIIAGDGRDGIVFRPHVCAARSDALATFAAALSTGRRRRRAKA